MKLIDELGNKKGANWGGAREQLGALSSEDDRILGLLEQGKMQAEIGTELGMHRSAVYRRVKRLRARLAEGSGESAS